MDSRSPRARDADATRADLLLAAKRRFAAHGYVRTRSRDVAADAGANVSLIYRYFGSKEGLFEAVLADSADVVTKLRDIPLEDLVDRFVAGLEPDAYPEYGNQHPLSLLLRDFSDDPRADALRTSTLTGLMSYLTAQMAGQDTPADARTRATLLLALFAGVVTLRTALPGVPYGSEDLDSLRTHLRWLSTTLTRGR
jgi:AcrR family transcriptional regulator